MTRFDAAELAERVNSAKLATLGMLVAGIAHELNTPLGALHSNQDVLSRALERLQGILADERVDSSELDEVRRIVQAVRDVTRVNTLAVDRMVAIVGSLRSFGQLDRSTVDRVDLREGLESTIALLRHQLGDRIAIRREYQELPAVECYPQQINQLFMNLLLNAVQAIRGRGTITVRTCANAGEAVVEVEDTGVGIPAQNLEMIFEPGFTTKDSRVGMGLGLLISKQIVEQHGGRIGVQSEIGNGTVFQIFLPERLQA